MEGEGGGQRSRIFLLPSVCEGFLAATYEPKKRAIIRKRNTVHAADTLGGIAPPQLRLTSPAFSISCAGK